MTLLACLLGVYVAICLLAFALQKRLVYFPDPVLGATPQLVGLQWKDILFDTEDGVRLHGWLVRAEPETPVLLFCHGNAGNISHRLDSIRFFRDLGLSVFIFDYRGYGRSEGSPTEEGTYEDARAAWRYLTEEEGYGANQIILFGRSLGSAVAVDLASRERPAGLIAEGAFPSVVDVGARAYWWLPVRLLARIRYDSRKKVSELSCPKLFIHSVKDDVVPIDLGRKIFEAASEPKSFLEVPGSHNEISAGEGSRYALGVAEFIERLRGMSPG
jgi:fermentation-respiration switch protein FrsA (DUF1100 family)